MTAAIRFVGLAFSILAAFVVITLVNQVLTARASARAEAAAVAAFARQADRLPPPLGPELLAGVRDYLDVVIGEEWALMDEPEALSPRAAAVMDQLLNPEALPPDVDGVRGRILERRLDQTAAALDRLVTARETRLVTARFGLSSVIWVALLVTAFLTLVIAVAYPAGADRRFKWLQVISVAVTVAIILFVVFVIEHPYQGSVAVQPVAYTTVLNDLP